MRNYHRLLACLTLCLLIGALSAAWAQDKTPVPQPTPGGAATTAPDYWTPDPPGLPDTMRLRGFRALPHDTDRIGITRAAGTKCTVIRVKLSDPRVHVKPIVAKACPTGDESFSAMLTRTQPTIAVTGTFFSKTDLKPVGDIVVDGRIVNQGLMGTAFALTDTNDVSIFRVRQGHAEDWSSYHEVMACGPALVLDGHVDVKPTQEGFHDPHIMGSTYRIGVGVTERREMLMVVTLSAVSFDQWARVMKALGCSGAMNLDAGASMAVYYRGHKLMSPSRRLTNLLGVFVDQG